MSEICLSTSDDGGFGDCVMLNNFHLFFCRALGRALFQVLDKRALDVPRLADAQICGRDEEHAHALAVPGATYLRRCFRASRRLTRDFLAALFAICSIMLACFSRASFSLRIAAASNSHSSRFFLASRSRISFKVLAASNASRSRRACRPSVTSASPSLTRRFSASTSSSVSGQRRSASRSCIALGSSRRSALRS